MTPGGEFLIWKTARFKIMGSVNAQTWERVGILAVIIPCPSSALPSTTGAGWGLAFPARVVASDKPGTMVWGQWKC